MALLWRVARLTAELQTVESSQLVLDLQRAIRDLDGAEPGWRERTPLRRSSNERKGKRAP